MPKKQGNTPKPETEPQPTPQSPASTVSVEDPPQDPPVEPGAGLDETEGLEYAGLTMPDTGLELVWMDPYELQANPLNPRMHPQAQRRSLHAALQSLGWLQPLLWNKRTGRLIDGHMRREEALESGITEVPVLVVDLEPHDERAALASIDAITQQATVDERAMQSLLSSLKAYEPDLTAALENLDNLVQEQLADPDIEPVVTKAHLVPGEKYNYVLVLFRNDIDWLRAVEHFGIDEPAVDVFHKSKVVGRTRVIDGSAYLERLDNGKDD